MNRLATVILDAILTPLGRLGPAAALALLALATAVGMLAVFKLLTNPRAIRRSRARVVSELLAIRLFKDDPWMTIRGLLGALRANAGYLRHALVPLVVMMVPIGLLVVHLDAWFGRRPLRVGDATRVAVVLEPGAGGGAPSVMLVSADADALGRETPPLWIPALHEVDWRVRVREPGVHALRFTVNGRSFTKEVVAGEGLRRATAVRPGGGLIEALLHPGEPELPADLGVRAVTVDYPPRSIPVLGVSMAWWLAFFLMALVFAFLLKKPLGVEA